LRQKVLCSALTEWWVSGRKGIDPHINYGQNKTNETERLVEHENRPNHRQMGPFDTQIGPDLSPSRKLYDEAFKVVHALKIKLVVRIYLHTKWRIVF